MHAHHTCATDIRRYPRIIPACRVISTHGINAYTPSSNHPSPLPGRISRHLPTATAPHSHDRCRYVQQYDETKPSTYKNRNLLVMTMDQLYVDFGLAEATIEFIGHAIALYPDVAYRKRPALPTVKRIALYYQSLTRFANLKSPYIYPLYGLGELPQVCPTPPHAAAEPRRQAVRAASGQAGPPAMTGPQAPVLGTARYCLPATAPALSRHVTDVRLCERGSIWLAWQRGTDRSPRLQAPHALSCTNTLGTPQGRQTRGCGLAPD